MSLFRQSVLALSLLIATLLIGNLYVSVNNARDYLSQQMQVHAEDAATSLAFSLSRATLDKDEALMGSMVDVIFDRGYYRLIEFRDLDGQAQVNRSLSVDVEGVPAWFVRALVLPEPQGRAEVISGWYRLGELVVVSHPGYAYRDLWRVFVELLQLSFVVALLCFALVGFGLKLLFKPLRQLEQQADAIGRREFPVQETLPRTPELRSIVLAMNRMVLKVKAMFQEQIDLSAKLHRQSWVDSLTQLSNRRDFDARLEALVRSERGGGEAGLMLLQLEGLQALNDLEGRAAGDELLVFVAEVLRRETEAFSESLVARRSGADFSVLLPAMSQQELERLADRIVGQVSLRAKVHIGLAHTQVMSLDSELLSLADLALRQAQHRANGQWLLLNAADEAALDRIEGGRPVRSASAWRKYLRQAFDQNLIHLHFQAVYRVDRTVQHYEVLSRIEEEDGSLIRAGVFWPMLERFGLALSMDRKVIELLQVQLSNAGPASESEVRYCVNLSPASIQNDEFIDHLDSLLTSSKSFTERVLFELPESCVAANHQAVKKFAELLRERGAALSLDHFGLGARAFNYLQSMPLSCLKVDQSFVHLLNEKADNQFFLRSLVQISRSCDVEIFAEGVETEAEWAQVIDLGLNGGQGYFLAEPGLDVLE